jgi:hypothetical protein
MTEKKPPSNIELERSVLGSIFFENDVIQTLIGNGVTSNTFYGTSNAIIFSVMDELYTDGVTIDQLTVTEEIRKRGRLDLITEEAIASLAGEITSSASAVHHAKMLKDLELLRKEIALFVSARNLAETDGADGLQIIETIITSLSDLKTEFGGGKHGLTEQIREFIESTTGNFSSTEVNNFLGKSTSVNNRSISAILCRMLKDGEIVRAGNKNGIFRKVDNACPVMDLRHVRAESYPIVWPFDLHKLVEIMPKNIVIVAGMSNAGKTMFCLNTARLNMNMENREIHYFSSEMGDVEIVKQLRKFDGLSPHDWKVKFRERNDRFEDVIVPNAMNIIDFMEIHEDHYKVGAKIRAIFERLTTGIAVIALQKKPGQELGVGGVASLEKARLYLALDYDKDKHEGKCTIVKAKNWASDINPNGMTATTWLKPGMNFEWTWNMNGSKMKPRYTPDYMDK